MNNTTEINPWDKNTVLANALVFYGGLFVANLYLYLRSLHDRYSQSQNRWSHNDADDY